MRSVGTVALGVAILFVHSPLLLSLLPGLQEGGRGGESGELELCCLEGKGVCVCVLWCFFFTFHSYFEDLSTRKRQFRDAESSFLSWNDIQASVDSVNTSVQGENDSKTKTLGFVLVGCRQDFFFLAGETTGGLQV